MAGGVLVFVEQRDGKVHPASLQMFTAARALAEGGAVHAVAIGQDVGAAGEAAAKHGAAQVYVADDAELGPYRALPYARALCAAIEQDQPALVLMATTSLSRDLAPRVAARLKAALATDCLEVARADGAVRVQRPMYAAKCVGEFTLAGDRSRAMKVQLDFKTPTQNEA